jgi:hypothetical protein
MPLTRKHIFDYYDDEDREGRQKIKGMKEMIPFL